ncbi:hypothetical protein H5410_054400 [Solanum commersonii]|uniref:C-JID domain-containing protein n=1 Tax=Solanum commersonii TaxID=4109 RepID=A0A9J5WF78_SOLCO|nr:hypothetical protein H5410_054400 [Solanum commersonii]
MHDLIEDMGKYILKMQKDSGKPSRIWNVEDFEDVMVDNMLFKNLKCKKKSYITCRKFARKEKESSDIDDVDRMTSFSSDTNCHDDSIEYLSNNLRGFVRHNYPWKLLPRNFNPRRLVHLDLRWSSLHYLWNETKQQFLSLRRIDLSGTKSLKRTPDFEVMPNLEYLDICGCTSLEEVHHSLKYCRKLIKLNLCECRSLDRFPYVNVESLESLDLDCCYSLEKFPEIWGRIMLDLKIKMFWDKGTAIIYYSSPSSSFKEIGDLQNLENLNATYTLISRPPSSIVRLNKHEFLSFGQPRSEDGVFFGNNFEYLPRSIAQLGALEYLDLSDCKRLTQLPEFPQQLDTIDADWSNDWMYSLSLRVLRSWLQNIPSWFRHQGMDTSVSVNLPENWYVSDNFLGFVVCYSGRFIDDITAHLIPLCDDGMSSMTQKFALSNHSEYIEKYAIHFLLIPLGGLWDASNANGKTPNDYANGKTPNDYGGIRLYSPGEINEYGVCLLYKDEAELHIVIRRSRNEHYEEASCSSSKKQRPLLQLFPTSSGL